MPELAEVEWFRKQWSSGIGHEIVDLRLHEKNRVFRGENVEELRRSLIGEKLSSSHARGKRMLFKFSGDNWLGIHLGMTGKIHVARRDYRPAKRDHLVLFQKDRALVFSDYRQFGRVRFHHGGNEPDWWKSEVPEIDSSQFDQKFMDSFLDRHRKAPIKAALLMQHGFPGIGNWMADEILWRAKVLPSKRIRKLTEQDRHQLFRATKFVVRRSLETLGKNFADPPRNWLIHQKWKRAGTCPKHHTLLRHATVAGRTTAWCPKCQST
jgi:formamidopyrimidine-DNA glycosylase